MGVLNATGHYPKSYPTNMLTPWKEDGGNLPRLKLAPSDYQGGCGQDRNENTGRAGKKMQEYHFSVSQSGLHGVHENRGKKLVQTAGGKRDTKAKRRAGTTDSQLVEEEHNS